MSSKNVNFTKNVLKCKNKIFINIVVFKTNDNKIDIKNFFVLIVWRYETYFVFRFRVFD